MKSATTDRWIPVVVSISRRPRRGRAREERVETEGLAIADVPGLAVCHPAEVAWTVTHTASGRAIAVVRSEGAAKRRLLELGPLGDWTRSASVIYADEAFCLRVKELIYGGPS